MRSLDTRALVAVAGLALLAPLLAQPASAAKARPDLAVTKVVLTTAAPTAGGTIGVKDTVRNIGRKKAGASTTGYWLSRDGSVGSGDLRLAGTRKVKILKPKRSHAGKATLVLPKSATGSWRVIACADTKRKVREAKEGNNCRASAAFTITTPDQEEPTATGTWAEASPRLRVLDRGNDHLLLSWPAAARDRATTSFRLAWNGGQLLLEPGIMHSQVTGLSPGGTYTFTVTAIKDGAVLPTPLSTSVQTTSGLQTPPDLTITTGQSRSSEVNGWQEWAGPTEVTSEWALRGAVWEYRIEVPNGALPGEETFRMSEVTAVGGVETSGGLVAGVQLEPSGLQLMEPATLEIRPRATTTEVPTGIIPLVFDGSGEAARLIAVDPASATYRFQLNHFSGVVIMEGSHDELLALSNRAASEIDRAANEVAAAAAEARERQLNGEEVALTELQAAIEAHLREQWPNVVVMLQAATTDDRLANKAITTAMALLRGAQMVGIDTAAEWAELNAYIPVITQNAYDMAKARCKVNLDPREAHTMLSIQRQAQMMGVTLQGAGFADALDCAATTLQVTIDGSFEEFDVPSNAGVCCGWLNRAGGDVSASVELQPFINGPNLYYLGVARPTLTNLVADMNRVCSVTVGAPSPDNAIPLVATPSINPRVDPDAPARIRLVITDFFPDGTQQPYFRTGFDVTYVPTSADGCGSAQTTQGSAWAGFAMEFGGIGGPWSLSEGTTTLATSSPQYVPANIGGHATIGFTVTPKRGGIG